MKKEKINFLKYDIPNALRGARALIREGKVIVADEIINELGLRFRVLFPFKYGSMMDEEGYSDEGVIEG